MKRLFQFLAVIGVIIYFAGWLRPLRDAFTASPSGKSPLANLLSRTSGESPLLLASSPSASIRTIADRVFEPLESEKIVTTQSAQKALAQVRTQISSNPHPDPRLTQALTLLDQAILERDTTIKRILGGGTHTRLDKVPGDWHSVDKPHQKIDLSANNTRRRNSFWATAELKKWHQRSAEYRTTIDSLLASPQRPQ